MIHDVAARLSASSASQIALIIAFVAFVAVVIWTYSGGRNRFAREASLPFDDADRHDTQSQTSNIENDHDSSR